MPSSLSLTTSCFWFKVRDVGLLLSLEQLTDYHQVINCSNFKAVVSQETGRPRKWGRERDWLVSGAVRTYTFGSLSYMPVVCGTPKNLQPWHQWSLTDHYNKENNNENIWNIARITKMWHKDTSEQMLLEKLVQTALLEVGLPQTFNL